MERRSVAKASDITVVWSSPEPPLVSLIQCSASIPFCASIGSCGLTKAKFQSYRV